uniref:non-specific serine/threonine protein kinase n=1 Tax=Timema monikensis TaxID=170555 RepID=A0A7R9EBB1_9NEOP|nr:unnamed protein product [Timema monikensis]
MALLGWLYGLTCCSAVDYITEDEEGRTRLDPEFGTIFANRWHSLAGHQMNLDMLTIMELRRELLRGNSPTDELLTLWGHQNHTVEELFVLLSQMQHYQAMIVLKTFVSSRFHSLIYEGEEYMRNLFGACGSKPSFDGRGGAGQEPDSEEPVTAPSVENRTSGRTHDDATRADMSKNIGFGAHNLNVTDSTASFPNKMVFPPQAPSERKVLNAMAILPPPLCPAGAQQSIRALHRAEDKENAVSQTTKPSNVSNASSIVDNCANVPEIEHKELKLATNNWDRSCILGKGGFGTVFKGKWKHTLVAIKRIEQRGAESVDSYKAHIEQSMHELRMLNSCRHDNILPVYGYSIKGGDPCLVYQLMPNGSLEDRLLCRNGTKPLTWPQRHNIAEGTARGLHFLHTNKPKPFIHGDVKSANILLDSNFEPRIGDFGLAQVGPAGQYTHMTVSRVHGTRPYLPDEFLRAKVLSTKVDTFSFGIVMFELATGQRPYDESRQHKFLKDYMCEVEESQLPLLVDKRAVPDDPALFDGMVQLGKTCVNKRHRARPEMEEVLTCLQGMCPIPVPQVCRQLSPNSSTAHYCLVNLVCLVSRGVSATQSQLVYSSLVLPGKPSLSCFQRGVSATQSQLVYSSLVLPGKPSLSCFQRCVGSSRCVSSSVPTRHTPTITVSSEDCLAPTPLVYPPFPSTPPGSPTRTRVVPLCHSPVNIVEPVGMNYQFPPSQGYYPPSPLNPFLEGLPRLSVQQEEEEEFEGPSGRFYRPQVQRTVSPVATNHLQFSPGNAPRHTLSPATPGVMFHRPMIQPSSHQPALPIPSLRLQRTESRSDSAFLPVCLLDRSSTESSLSSSKEQEKLSNGRDDVAPNKAGLPFVSELALPLISELGIKEGGGTTALGKDLAL